MKKMLRKISFKKTYSGNFDLKIYKNFKKIARNNNYGLNVYLNKKIEELKDNIKLKKYEEDKNYKAKKLFLKKENHKFTKNMYYIHDLSMRDYLQSLMEEVIRESKLQSS